MKNYRREAAKYWRRDFAFERAVVLSGWCPESWSPAWNSNEFLAVRLIELVGAEAAGQVGVNLGLEVQ